MIRHPEALGNGFFSISLLTRTSTGFSRSSTVSVYTQFFLSSSHVRHIFLSLLGLSFYNHTLRYAPPSRFFIYSILEAAIDTRFSFLHRVGQGKREENECERRSCSRVRTPALARRCAPPSESFQATSPPPPNPDTGTRTSYRSPRLDFCIRLVRPTTEAEVELPSRHLFLKSWQYCNWRCIEFDVVNVQAIGITNVRTGDKKVNFESIYQRDPNPALWAPLC